MKSYEKRFFMPVFVDGTITIDLMDVSAIQLNASGKLLFYMSGGQVIDMESPNPAKTYREQVSCWVKLHSGNHPSELDTLFQHEQLPDYLKIEKGESK